MKQFNLFLDIDGVFVDMKYVKEHKEIYHGGIINHFNPDSVKAFNKLTSILSKKYSINLVIISTWRNDMQKTIQTLWLNGVNFSCISKVDRTKLLHLKNRQDEILDYMATCQNKENYCVIDDEATMFDKLNKSKLIIPNIYNCSLNNEMVEKFLNQHNCEQTF